MNFDEAEQTTMLRDTLRRFVEKEMPRELARTLDKNASHSREAFSKLCELGVTALAVPEEYGGSGVDILSAIVVIEELAKRGTSLAGPVHPLRVLWCPEHSREWQRGAEGRPAAEVCAGRDPVRVRSERARRRGRPRLGHRDGDAQRGRQVRRHQRHQALGHGRANRRLRLHAGPQRAEGGALSQPLAGARADRTRAG